MEEKIIGILKSISELLVATLVEETDQVVRVKDVAFLGISGANGQISINFIPIEMLSLQPPVNIRNLLANPTQTLVYTFDKNSVLIPSLELGDNVITNYKQLLNKPVEGVVGQPSKDVVKLF